MKVLVYGAGVIGCYLTHVLCKAGHEVYLLARGAWKDELEKNGLRIRHHLQRQTTLDHPQVVSQIPERVCFDAVFAAMPYPQMEHILPDLGRAKTDLIVLIGNNMHPEEMQKKLRSMTPGIPDILFAFQVTGGQRFPDHVVVERFGKAGLDIGALHGFPSRLAQEKLEQIFRGTGYKMHYQRDMKAYLFCHPAAVLPIAYLAYVCGGDLRTATAAQRKQMLHAPAEAYDTLTYLGIPILPEKDDLFYRPGFRRALMRLLYFIMSKSSVGDLIACAHCRHAVGEMEQLDRDFTELLSRANGAPAMPVWQALKQQMPSWAELHRLYDAPSGIS
ncbi:MAG: ketopantoate reductase family protein [Clostridia bacterium]|nr:ketopantoate reductase family protein [Clostridia bacterium]